MLDATTKTARAVATGAVIGAAVVHSCMNATFGWSLGAHDFERYLFATFGVSADVCKVFALGFACLAFERGRWAKGTCCLIVFVATIAYSGVAALGFAALARDTVVASRTADVEDYTRNVAEKRRLLADMDAARLNPVFEETYGCTQTDEKSKTVAAKKASTFCHRYWAASAKYDAVQPVVRNAQLTQADPQTAIFAQIIASVTGRSSPADMVAIRGQVAMGLALFLAIVAEIVSSLGTWTFSKSMRRPDKTDVAERRAARQRPRLAVNNG